MVMPSTVTLGWDGGDAVQISGGVWDGFGCVYDQSTGTHVLIAPQPQEINAAQDLNASGEITNMNGKRTELLGVSGWEFAA